MGTRVITPPKYQGETINVSFNFISQLAVSETVLSATCTATVFSGTDSNPAAILNGSPSIAGTMVTQSVQAGVLGVIYELLIKAITSLGQSLEISTYLAIVPDLP